MMRLSWSFTGWYSRLKVGALRINRYISRTKSRPNYFFYNLNDNVPSDDFHFFNEISSRRLGTDCLTASTKSNNFWITFGDCVKTLERSLEKKLELELETRPDWRKGPKRRKQRGQDPLGIVSRWNRGFPVIKPVWKQGQAFHIAGFMLSGTRSRIDKDSWKNWGSGQDGVTTRTVIRIAMRKTVNRDQVERLF